jgi:twitching motility protein PilT
MPLVDSLLTAIVRSDGDALVLHVGEKPYVVAATGSVELSRQGLGLGAMEGLLAQLLSAEALRGLREMGAVEHELAASPAGGADRFTVVAARGGDDIWIEVRRHRRMRPQAPVVVEIPVAERITAVSAGTPAAEELPARDGSEVPDIEVHDVDAHGIDAPREPAVEVPVEGPVEEPAPAVEALPDMAAADTTTAEAIAVVFDPVSVDPPEVAQVPVLDTPTLVAPEATLVAVEPPRFDLPAPEAHELPATEAWAVEHVPAIDFNQPIAEPTEAEPPLEVADDVPVAPAPPSFDAALVAGAVPPMEPPPAPPAPIAEPEPAAVPEPAMPEFMGAAPAPVVPAAPVSVTIPAVPLAPEPQMAPPSAPAAEPYSASRYDAPAAAASPRAPMPRVETAVPEPPAYLPIEPQPTLPGLPPSFDDTARGDATPDALPGVVLSLTRDSARAASQSARGHGRAGGIERLLRLAAARGASALYLTTQARPAVRVDGDIRLLEGESALSSGDVEAAVLELAPEGARDKESAEWIRDLQDVGRVRITTFRDYRGPGALLRMISARATSAEQLGLVREIQALAMEPEGLVVVTGPRASGKSTLVSAFVDLINRQRNDYVITLEGQIRLVHESRGSLISQREVRGSAGEIVAAARAALRENPDVLIIEDLRSPDVLQVALDAAGSGLLVFASVTAASATAALERLVDLCPSEQRRAVRAALAEHLRGVVAQVLLRKAGGGRLAARELVLNTNAVAALVSDGQIAQLPRAIDSGRKLGMAPLNDALVAFVQSGAVDVREAYRKADDKVGLLGLLRREGIDTSFVERLA